MFGIIHSLSIILALSGIAFSEHTLPVFLCARPVFTHPFYHGYEEQYDVMLQCISALEILH